MPQNRSYRRRNSATCAIQAALVGATESHSPGRVSVTITGIQPRSISRSSSGAKSISATARIMFIRDFADHSTSSSPACGDGSAVSDPDGEVPVVLPPRAGMAPVEPHRGTAG